MPRYESSHELVIRQKKAKNEAFNTYGGGAGPQGGGYHRGGQQGGHQGHRGPSHHRGVWGLRVGWGVMAGVQGRFTSV